MDCRPPGSCRPPGYSRQEYWESCHTVLQGIFLARGSNPLLFYLLHWQAGSLPLVPPGKPWGCESHSVMSNSSQSHGYTVHGILQARILEWVAFAFSRGSSQPRDQTSVSCIAGRFFTIWTTRETHKGRKPGGIYWEAFFFFFLLSIPFHPSYLISPLLKSIVLWTYYVHKIILSAER